MNKKIIGIIVTIGAVFFVGILIWNWKKVENLEQKSPQKDNIEQIQSNDSSSNEENNRKEYVDTSSWKTYRDEKYNFEIKYNPNWKIKYIGIEQSDTKEILYITINGEDGRPLFIQSPVQAWETMSVKNPKEWWNEKNFMSPSKEIIEEKEYLINENLTYFVKVEKDRCIENYYVISNGKSIVCFYFEEKAERVDIKTGRLDEVDFSRYFSDFEVMVNSIRFLD